MTYGYYHASNALTDITDQLIQEMALGKKTVYLFLDHLPDRIALKAYNHLHKVCFLRVVRTVMSRDLTACRTSAVGPAFFRHGPTTEMRQASTAR